MTRDEVERLVRGEHHEPHRLLAGLHRPTTMRASTLLDEGVRLAEVAGRSALVAEVGDMRRFDNQRQLMAHLGLVPLEHSSGSKRRQGAITKAGSPLARRMLVEGAWTYRLPARVSAQMRPRLAGLPREVREVAWKAQLRLCGRYRRLQAMGKRPQVVVTAIAREMVGFAWAIARMAASPAGTA